MPDAVSGYPRCLIAANLDLFPSSQLLPEDVVLHADRLRVAAALLMLLTPSQRRVIILRYREEETFSLIARRLQISEVAVYRLHSRALGRMRKRLAEMRVFSVRQVI